jgi:YYY domain-containing protein
MLKSNLESELDSSLSALKAHSHRIALVAVIAIGAVLRFSGINWDSQTHMHPDERFLTTVETSITIPNSLAAYFDTQNSPLNPHNTGHGFFVYGTLPIFLVRVLGEWSGEIGYGQIHLIGRAASASFDVLSIFLIYLIGRRLYDRRVGLIAAAFAAFTALLIQHAHFFVVDPFANTFILAAIYFAVVAIDDGRFRNFAMFGLFAGLAAASKISAAPVALVIVLTWLIRWQRDRFAIVVQPLQGELARLVLAAVVSLVAFRLFQPYAFKSFSLALNPLWVDNIRSLISQTSGAADFPPAWQWADRIPLWFAFKNLVMWGMGWPLGLLAWFGWGWALTRVARGEWRPHLIPVAWTGAYFLLRGMGFVSAMRYQLPIYPTLALMAAWSLREMWNRYGGRSLAGRINVRVLIAGVGTAVTLATAAYGVALAANYVKPFTRYEASEWIYRNVPGPVNLVIQTDQGQQLETIPLPSGFELIQGNPFETFFTSRTSGQVTGLLFPHVSNLGDGSPKALRAVLLSGGQQLAEVHFSGSTNGDSAIELGLERPVVLQEGQELQIRLELTGGSRLGLRGSKIVVETSWDDALPLRIEGRDGFGGLYSSANQEMYWADGTDEDGSGIADKAERIVSTLDEGDYLVITSSRQYGSVGRLPQRYPITAAYYRQLFGCPSGAAIEVCAADARPGQITGSLGYELVATFQRDPSIGSIVFRDQPSEEAFTVYDHPKVFVFAKTEAFDPAELLQGLSAISLSGISVGPPGEVGSPPPNLLLTEDQLVSQRSGGTWSQIFSPESLINRSQPLAVLVWWAALGLLGLLAFPLVRTAFPGLRTGGYPLARLVAILFTAWASWLAGSIGLPYGRGTILLAVLLMLALSAALSWRRRTELIEFLREHRREILWVELIALGFFLFDLSIRLGNPDLWHRWLGGEKPMDFSYLNAVLKSTSFPPYDPWYAGGYINYYYFGFVLVGTPIRLIGIEPSVAYNLVLPTLFSVAALAAYAVGTNLVARLGSAYASVRKISPRVAGLAAALALVVLGNLGTVRLIYDALQEIGARGSDGSVPGLVEASIGLSRVITLQEPLPIGLHHWYWDPSRAISAPEGEVGPITEFPFFTFLYADLHAHMISLPLTVLALAWGISWLLAADRRIEITWPHRLVAIGIGALVLGALGPTNTWDYPVYWTLGALAVAAAPFVRERELSPRAALEATVSVGVLLASSYLLYRPYHLSYGLGYTQPGLWQGSRTSLDGYLTVHGLYLVVLLPWLAWETRQWMAATPLSALSRLRPYFGLILTAGLLMVFSVAYLTADGLSVTPLVALMLIWSGLLLLRRQLPIEKRAVLFMVGTAAALTFLVEVVVLVGDIGRMNTVFKFYLQVWTLFSLSASAALVWLLADLPGWGRRARTAWSIAFVAAAIGASLYPLTATSAKIRDRISTSTPVTLDGMAYMTTATYDDLGQSFSLESDYHAIRWMQRNVEGSPVIVEAQIPEYRWGSRYSIYTGLPAVLGWNWHQRQQRAAVESQDISTRAQAISSFYVTESPTDALAFLDQYDVRYIVVGELERLYYGSFDKCAPLDGGLRVNCDLAGRLGGQWILDVPATRCEDNGSSLVCPTGGIEKFEAMESLGMLRAVYRNGGTVIYEVGA